MTWLPWTQMPRARRSNPRVLAAAIGVVVVAVLAIVLAVAATGGKSSGTAAATLPGARDVNTLLRGIPQDGLTLGSPTAPVTLTEYIDLQCPFCQQFETQVLPQIVKSYVRTGKVKIEARVLAFIGPDSVHGRDAMLAAAKQGKAFNFAQVLYDNQGIENTGWLDDAMVASAAKSVPGLNSKLLLSTQSSASVTQQAKAIDSEATARNVVSTPTVFVNGKQVQLASPTDLAGVVKAFRTAGA
jgi:protein-disulfide isomerase